MIPGNVPLLVRGGQARRPGATSRRLARDCAGGCPYDAGVSGAEHQRAGIVAAASAFSMWGLFPLYWKMLAGVPALEVVAHRTFWGLVSVAAWVTVRRGWPAARAVVRNPRALLVLAGTALLIGVNWLIFIWAVINGHVVESSLGYFINPLVNVALGVIVLRERLSRAQVVAVALAGTGVAVLTVGYGRFPWIALALAVSFALYGLARKTVAADAVTGLLVETAILAPAALALLVSLAARGGGAFVRGGVTPTVLLALGGAITALPLVLFAFGARRLPLSTVGFLQYISPTCQFLLAVFLYREPFTAAHAATFACIWAALALLMWDLKVRFAAVRNAAPADGSATAPD
jgi:chloramphenicol-sensitive protein RarD